MRPNATPGVVRSPLNRLPIDNNAVFVAAEEQTVQPEVSVDEPQRGAHIGGESVDYLDVTPTDLDVCWVDAVSVAFQHDRQERCRRNQRKCRPDPQNESLRYT
jgi:hypothetical protein